MEITKEQEAFFKRMYDREEVLKNKPKTPKGRCPICGGRLEPRHSSHGGYFLGCSNFPKCDYREGTL